MMSLAMPCGILSAIVSSPAVTSSCTLLSGFFATTIVSGPGQKAAARPAEIPSNAPWAIAMSTLATWAISGLKRGRPFISKIRATANPLVASAASPYTVSVGSATHCPRRNAATAGAAKSSCD